MYLDLINTSFTNNKADFVFVVVTNHYYTYSRITVIITTAVQVLQSTFFNNNCSSLISLHGIYILAMILDVQVTHNALLLPGYAYGTLVAFLNYV